MPVTYNRARELNIELIKAIEKVKAAYPDKNDNKYLQNRGKLLSHTLLETTEHELRMGNEDYEMPLGDYESEEDE